MKVWELIKSKPEDRSDWVARPDLRPAPPVQHNAETKRVVSDMRAKLAGKK